MKTIANHLFIICTWVMMAGNSFAFAPENGWWWNPSESGSGYAIERQGNALFMAAFLYEVSGSATWYATAMTLQPDGSYKGNMTRYVGGKSLLGIYKAPTSTTVVASASATFPYPGSGTLTISFTNGSPTRTVPIRRFAFGSPTFEPTKGLFQNGWWWNDLESGTGYFIEVQGYQAFIASFMYDISGQPTWYASAANLSGTNFLSGPLDMYSNGQALDGNYKAPAVKAGAAGNMSYSFQNDTLANMILPNGTNVPIKRFIFDTSNSSNHPPIPNAGKNQTVTVGDTVYLNGSGTDTDGDPLTFSWRFLTAPNGSTTSLYSWTTTRPYFVADISGIYRFELIADDGKVSNGQSVVTVTANPKEIINIAPNANAGPNQTVTVGSLVRLNGAGSSDPNGDAISYSWFFVTKPNGSSAALSGSNTISPYFTADTAGNYVIGLNVNDGKVNSAQSTVTITASQVSITNIPPVANAGLNQNVNIGTLVRLSGAASSDANGDPLTFLWTGTGPVGNTSILYNYNTVSPYFTPNIVGVYIFTLVVNDGKVNSSSSSVTINVSSNGQTVSTDCSSINCASVNATSYSGNGIGVWKYINSSSQDAVIDLNISGISSGKTATLLFSNGSSSLSNSIPSKGYLSNINLADLNDVSLFSNNTLNNEINLRHSHFASHLDLHTENENARKFLAGSRLKVLNSSLEAPNYYYAPSIGSSKVWMDTNGGKTDNYNTTLQARCPINYGRYVSIWVDNNSISSGQVTSSAINQIVSSYCGAYGAAAKLTSLLGDFWGPSPYSDTINDTPMQDINIAIINNSSTDGWAGYFFGGNTILKSSSYPNSNEANVFFISANQLSRNIQYTLSTLIHESTHMINWYQQTVKAQGQKGYESWLDESSALSSEDIITPSVVKNTDGTGYNPIATIDIPRYLITGAGVNYTNWPKLSANNYYMASAFMAYLNRTYGLSFYKNMINCTKPSYTCVDNLIKSNGGTGFAEDFARMGASIFSLMPSNGAPLKYGYPSITDSGYNLQPIDLSGYSSIRPTSASPLSSGFTATTHTYQIDLITTGKSNFTRSGIIVPANTNFILVIK